MLEIKRNLLNIILVLNIIFLGCNIILCIGNKRMMSETSEAVVNDDSDKGDTRTFLVIPLMEDIKENGYPVNENGQTYGNEYDWAGTPDLRLVRNDEGLMGYIYTDEPKVSSPEEAIQYMENIADYMEISMYLQDGETIVGTYSYPPLDVELKYAE